MDIEATYRQIGYWGFYQKRLCILLLISTIPNGILVMVPVFTHETPPHRCFVPDVDNVTGDYSPSMNNHSHGNASINDILAFYIPMEEKDGKWKLSSCKMFADQLTDSPATRAKGNITSTQADRNSTDCQYGWVYDGRPGQETVVTKWDLVCGNAWIKPMLTSTQMVGVVISAFITGYISDKYGRHPAFFWSTFLQGLFTLLAAFAINIPMYSIFLMIAAAFNFTNFSAAVVIGSEMLSPKIRGISGNLEMIGFAIGYMVLPLIAYLALTYQNIYIFIGASTIFYIPYWWWVLESPRWLIQRNRPKEAAKIFTKVAKINGTWDPELEKDLSESVLLECSNPCKKEDESASIHIQYTYLDLFSHAAARKRIIILGYSWAILTMTYYFFSYNTGNLGGNSYTNCLFASLVEIPAALISMAMMTAFGRSLSFITLMMSGAISCGATPFVLDTNLSAGIAVAMFGKLALTAAFDLAYLYTSEMFPTLLRYKALAIASFLGRIGGIAAPYMVYWGENNNRYMPYIFMAVLAAVSALLAFFLPETRNVPLPDTMEDAKQMKSLLEMHGHRGKQSWSRRSPESSAI